MEPVIAHLQENALAYGVFGALAVFLLYLTRQWTFPFVFHTFELLVYGTLFHLVLAGVVRAGAWFRNETTMDRAFDEDARGTVTWTTPVMEFWDKTQYDPVGLYYFEAVVAVLIVLGVIYFRPMKAPMKNRYQSKRADYGTRNQPQRGGYRGQYSRAGQGRRR